MYRTLELGKIEFKIYNNIIYKIMDNINKTCSKCKRELSLNHFYKDKKGKCGVKSKCKNCINEHNKEYNKINKQKIKEYRKEYNKINKQKIQENKKEYKQKIKQNCIYYYSFNNIILYVGSTISPLNRKNRHKNENILPFHKYLKNNNIKYENLEYTQVNLPNYILTIHRYSTEQYYINTLKPICNKKDAIY
jgi:hypothetical protein